MSVDTPAPPSSSGEGEQLIIAKMSDGYYTSENGSERGRDFDEFGDTIQEEETKVGNSGFSSSLFNLLNTILGGGILALPQAFALSGLMVGVIVTVVIGFLSAISSWLIVKTAKQVGGIKSYKDLANIAFGTLGSFTIDLCLIFYLFGVMTGYIVIIADILTPYLVRVAGVAKEEDKDSDGNVEYDDFYWRVLVSVIAVFTVLLPISFLPKIDFLKYTSTVALICILYMVLAISFSSISDLTDEFREDDVLWGNKDFDSLSAAPVIVFAFSFHTSLFPIKNEMKNPEKITQIVASACVISGMMYITVGLFGYLTFLECVESNVLVNFDESVSIIIAKISLVVVLCFSYPIMNFACRISVWNLLFPLQNEPSCWDWWPARVRKMRGREDGIYENLLDDNSMPNTAERRRTMLAAADKGDKPKSIVPYCIVTICLSVSALILSILVPDIQSIFGLVGATAGSVVVFIFPGAATIRLDTSPVWTKERVLGYFFVVLGTVAAVLGTGISLYNWNKEFLSDSCE